MREINRIIIHCSATPAGMDIGRDEIDQWHRERGWNGIGYHYVIRRNGDIEFGRPEYEVGAHTRGYNEDSIGICLVGGKDTFDYTADQIAELVGLVENLEERYPDATIHGHNEFSAKLCPRFDVAAFFN